MRKRNPEKHRPERTVEGVIVFSSKGDGYVAIEEFEEDILIPAEKTGTALTGDMVRIAIDPPTLKLRRAGPLAPRLHRSGRVLAVLKRDRTRFVGTIEKRGQENILIPDDRKVPVTFLIAGKTGNAGHKALVELISWDNRGELPKARLIQDIGKKGENETEMRSILLARGFETGFPEQVEQEAENIRSESKKDSEREASRRRDMRGTATFTIDPENAKDFDDALSFKKVDSGYEIGIHIADVSHYLRPGSALDKEAQKRGVSVYLVDRTIPMLPEALSNDLCSLNPNEDKLTFSAIFTLSPKGKVLSRWFGKTIIRSHKRFTYESAQQTINKKSGELAEELMTLNSLAKLMRKERMENGAIEFQEEEVAFRLDENGKPLSVSRKPHYDTNDLIEEFMLLANREVATFINTLKKHEREKPPLFMYRIHDFPDQEKMTGLALFLKAIGHELKLKGGRVSGKDINALFKRIEGKAEEGIIKTAAVRAMAKAIYSTKNIGHFGLGFDYYTHFTSPIRRYPDVMVHRLLEHYLARKRLPEQEFGYYERLAAQTTEAEIRATEAERESVKLKQVEFMTMHIGKTFEGIISGVTEWGIYIEEKETKSEGMVKLRDLTDDYYVLDAKNYRLVGQKTKKKYSLGGSVRFKITGADVERKTLDFTLVSNPTT